MGLAWSSSAFAQEQEQAAAVDTPPADEIVVTGSRISRRDLVAASPIVTLVQEDITRRGEVTIEKALSQLPQFGLGENSTQTGFNSTGQATLNLRGLGSARNLVLLDGRRMQPSNIQQVVDINTIPAALIESVEVITGGASAVYGSDAVAGVINFRTRKRFEGVQIDAQYTLPEEGDGAGRDIAATIGSNFGGGRGNAVVSIGYTDRNPVDYQSRPFFRRHLGGTDLRIPTGVYAPGANAPSQAALDALFASYGVAAGSVARNSGLSFNADGTIFSASNGVFNFRGSQGGLLLNTGRQVNNLNRFLVLQAPIERITGFTRTTYDLGGEVELFAQAQYADYDTRIYVEPGNTSISIPVTNPFIPAELRTLLASRADPDANLILEKRFIEAGPRLTDRKFEVYQLLAGLRGKLSGLDGSWEVFASHGSTSIDDSSPGSVKRSALTAIINAPDGGNALCAGGYNPFGINPLSEACSAYLVASPTRSTKLDQDIVEANLQGRLLALPGGDARFALGGAYRRNSYETEPDAILSAGDVVGVTFTRASAGATSVYEGYAELLLPILADRPFVRSLELSLGYRYSHYNLAGGVHTYKADGTWSPIAGLRFRGGYARAVRAPSVAELFVAPTGSVPSIGRPSQGQGDPCNSASPSRQGPQAAAVRALCLAQGVPVALIDAFVNLQDDSDATSVGNPDLQPEKADTFTVGLTLDPRLSLSWLDGLSLSVDYYNIELEGAVGVVSSLQSVASCFNIDGANTSLSATNEFCANISRDPVTGRISQVLQPTRNLGAFRTAGVDVALNWAVPIGPAQRLSFSTLITYLDKFDVQAAPGRPFLHYAGTVGGTATFQPGSLPKWKATSEVSYTDDGLTIGGRWRFLDKMEAAGRVINPAATAPGVGAYSLFDLFADLRINRQFAFRAGVNNVADREPPILNGVIGTTESSTYDVLGRTVFVATRVNF